MLRTLGRDRHATSIIGIRFAFEDTFDRLELTTHLFYHLLSCTTYGVHRQTAEQEGHHRADKDTDEYDRVHEVHIICVHEVHERCFSSLYPIRQCFAGTDQGNLDLLYIRSQECERREGSRTDSKALTGSRCGVTKCIEGIGTLTNLCRQTRHLGVTAGVVRDRTVGVGSECDT